MKKHYQEIVDEIFGDYFKHRTLRTLFDPNSSEWNDTTVEKKLEILKTILDSGKISLWELILRYKLFYTHELENKGHVVDSLEEGLVVLLSRVMKS